MGRRRVGFHVDEALVFLHSAMSFNVFDPDEVPRIDRELRAAHVQALLAIAEAIRGLARSDDG
jgi:hypothetical protein